MIKLKEGELLICRNTDFRSKIRKTVEEDYDGSQDRMNIFQIIYKYYCRKCFMYMKHFIFLFKFKVYVDFHKTANKKTKC